MSRFRKLSQIIWHCQYHIIWVPKYRYRVLSDKIAMEVENCVRAFSEQLGCEIVELNVQIDHVHLLAIAGAAHFASLGGKAPNPFQGLHKYRPLWGRIFILRSFF